MGPPDPDRPDAAEPCPTESATRSSSGSCKTHDELKTRASDAARAEDWAAAEELLSRVLETEPSDSATRATLGRARRKLRVAELLRQAARALEGGFWDEGDRLLQDVEAIEPGCGASAELQTRIEGHRAAEGLFVEGRRAFEAGELEAALSAFHRLHEAAPDFPGSQDWPARIEQARQLEASRRLRGAVLELASDGPVPNPHSSSSGTEAYELLAFAGVHRMSSMGDLLAISETLMQGGPRTHELRSAQDRLRLPERRLKVDFFFHRAALPARLRAFVAGLGPVPQMPSDETLASTLDRDAGLVLMKLGLHERAIALWERLQHRRMEDVGLSHDLALAHLGRAEVFEETGQFGRATDAWQMALSHLARVLETPDFSRAWLSGQAAIYRQPLTSSLWSEVRTGVEEHLHQRWEAWSKHHDATGRNERRPQLAALKDTWTVERLGAFWLRRAGGIRANEPSAEALTGGPSFVTQNQFGDQVGLLMQGLEPEPAEERRARFVNEALDPDDGAFASRPGPAVLGQVRRFFSRLSMAAMYLERGQPRSAIAALSHLACEKCLQVSADTRDEWLSRAPATLCPRLCEPGCPEFPRINPAHSRLGHRHAVFREDACSVAMEARLSMATEELGAASPEVSAVLGWWKEALDLSGHLGASADILARIREEAIHRAGAFRSNRTNWESSFGVAISVLEGTLREFGDAPEGRLTRELAETLTGRAVALANEERRFDESSRDLRQAFELVRPSSRIRDNLCCALIHSAIQLQVERHQEAARELLEEAEQLLRESEELEPAFPGFPETREFLKCAWVRLDPRHGEALDQTFEKLEQTLDSVTEDERRSYELTVSGLAKLSQADLESGIDDLRRACRLDPDNGTAANALLEALDSLGRRYAVEGDLPRGLALLRHAVREFPTCTTLRGTLRSLETLERAPKTNPTEFSGRRHD
ncbi:MAG: hypothetical protein HY814_06565 [Candidatus Riflebacteria bacterium]|nr:hypothetical protein [Candidatus Riflebacteria bacterium]